MNTTLNYNLWVICTFYTGFPGKPDQSWLTSDALIERKKPQQQTSKK